MAIAIFFVGHWWLSVFSQTFFLHRYGAHRMFTMSKGWERFFYLFTYLTQGSSFLVPKGYAVLRVNPRGSIGYGLKFKAANFKDWGGGDYNDIMTGVDELVRRGIADSGTLPAYTRPVATARSTSIRSGNGACIAAES